MGSLPLLREDAIVFHNRLLDPVGGQQDLLVILFGIHLNLMDLSTMGPPLPFCVIHLKKWISMANKKPYVCFLP